MNALRQWLTGVIGCAMLTSLLEQLCPEGGAKKVLRFAGGLLLVLSLLRPAAQLRLPETSGGGLRAETERLERTFTARNKAVFAARIAEGTRAYIEDKAAELGLRVRAEVRTETTGGLPLPESVTLHGEESEALSTLIEAQLGIPKEKQRWTTDG